MYSMNASNNDEAKVDPSLHKYRKYPIETTWFKAKVKADRHATDISM